jgi:hypothetical protein
MGRTAYASVMSAMSRRAPITDVLLHGNAAQGVLEPVLVEHETHLLEMLAGHLDSLAEQVVPRGLAHAERVGALNEFAGEQGPAVLGVGAVVVEDGVDPHVLSAPGARAGLLAESGHDGHCGRSRRARASMWRISTSSDAGSAQQSQGSRASCQGSPPWRFSS